MSRPDPENAKPGVRLSDTTFSAVPAQPLSGAEHLAAGLASAAASGFRGGPVSRRNYVLGILNGALGTVAYDFIHPDLILAGLVFTLSRTAYGEGVAFFLVAVLSIINKGGSLLPQLYVSSLLEHRPRKRPFYVLLTFIRGGGAAALVLSIWLLASRVDALALAMFFISFLVIASCMGAGHVITLDMFGRMIKMDRIGSFLGTREFLGGALSLVAGLVIVQPILARGQAAADNAVLAFNYFLLGIVGSTLTVVSMTALILCREEEGPRARRRTTFLESLIRGWRWLKRNRDYRAYFWLRVAFRVNDLGLAFFIPYGEQRLRPGDPGAVVVLGGLFVATFKLSRVLSSLLWGWTVDRYGDRACLVWTGMCFVLAPILALAAPLAPGAFAVPIPMTETVLDLPLVVYLLALAGIGTAYQGSIIGGNRFLIGRAPPRRRLSYIGFLNTVTSPLTLLPVLGAVVAAHLGVTALFVAIVGGGLLYLVWSIRMRPEAEMLARGRRGGVGEPESAEVGP
ncbi:MAG: MFS transporter [Planctomycetes bacterium]|nr:MFS transporter [Planctomycetota bacterium]